MEEMAEACEAALVSSRRSRDALLNAKFFCVVCVEAFAYDLVEKYAAAAKRSARVGFDVIEIHGAHGYLLASFLSPVSNTRNDEYGGDIKGRMRFPLEVAEAVRGAIPDSMPLFFRVSSVDGTAEGWNMDHRQETSRMKPLPGKPFLQPTRNPLLATLTPSSRPRKPTRF